MLIILGAAGGLGSGLTDYIESNPRILESYGQMIKATRKEIDLESLDSVEQFFQKVNDNLSPTEPLYVINAVGVSINGMIHKLGIENWEKTVRVNLDSSYYLLKTIQPFLQNRSETSVLFFGSVVSEVGVLGASAYASSKAALHGLVKTASKEFARYKGRVNCIDLGYFDRGMINQVPSEALFKIIEQIPLRRLGTSEDLFLACDFALKCKYLTGAILPLNGGLL